MRVLTPFLWANLHPALSKTLEECIAARNAPDLVMGPNIVLISKYDIASNAVLIHDGRHSIWAFLPPDTVQKAAETWPHIQSLKNLSGALLRVNSCRFTNPFRQCAQTQTSKVHFFPIALEVGDVGILDVAGAQVNENPHVLIDVDIKRLMDDRSFGHIEAAILPPSAGHYHAFFFNDQNPLTVEDCIVPPEQEQLLAERAQASGRVVSDSQLIAENGSVPDSFPESIRDGSTPPSPSSLDLRDSLPLYHPEELAARSESQPLSQPVAAPTSPPHQPRRMSPLSMSMLLSSPEPSSRRPPSQPSSSIVVATPTQTSTAPSDDLPYAFCHQSLMDNFIPEDTSSMASSQSTASSAASSRRVGKDADKENLPHDHRASSRKNSTTSSENNTKRSRHSTQSPENSKPPRREDNKRPTPRKLPLANATNLIVPSGASDKASSSSSKSSHHSLKRRAKHTASTHATSTFEWVEDEHDDSRVSQTQWPTTQAHGTSSRASTASASPRRVILDDSQWFTQLPSQTTPATQPRQRRRLSDVLQQPPKPRHEDEVVSLLDESDESDDDTARSHVVEFRHEIKHGRLDSIRVATVDCTAGVRALIASVRANDAKLLREAVRPSPVAL
ncbi:Aste57867_8242 [Aphanomyces stellatus]|uniref:Aste57867_8242 protein n=1 Tax=Aphanomyces stellatus TaxID=120398 RepID=A0A485KJP6_9STRA|nr:hypothetical protein As57867_008211 [Aphanomyces stellatus]VFT85129.1 Aste57867_8242 [Aphanomyces stellatus]